jgi:hypothetical protein
MGKLLAVYKSRYLLRSLLSDLGFSEDKTPYSFKYVAMSYLVNQNVPIKSINEAARYTTGSKIVRDGYVISAAPTVDILSSREEHLIPFSKGTLSSTSKSTFLGNVLPKSKPLINLSTFTPKSSTENNILNTKRSLQQV